MENLAKNFLKCFGRLGYVSLPHKLKSYDIFWKLFYHILSFFTGKGLLILLDTNYHLLSKLLILEYFRVQVLDQLPPFCASVTLSMMLYR